MESGEKVKVGPWEWTVWPTLWLPSEAELIAWAASKGPSVVQEYWERREAQIARERADELNHGWESPVMGIMRALLAGSYRPGMIGTPMVEGWTQPIKANDILELGGNGSGKTFSLAKLTMEVLVAGGGREVRCWSQNETTSRMYQQPPIFNHLPPHLKTVKKIGQVTKISYQVSTGFSDNIFVLPNESKCLLQTYKGWEQDRKSAEGGEADAVWWDEEAPGELVETLRFRTHKKGGVMLGSFTPVAGYTETVGQYLEGAEILETVPAATVVWNWREGSWSWGERVLPADKVLVPGCPPGHVPLVLQSGAGGGRRYVVAWPTPFNPYTNVQAIISAATGKTAEFALERVWGWPTKRAMKAFPGFSRAHIVEPDRVPALEDLTLYQNMDPHGQRNWFMLWIGIDRHGVKWVVREWPGIEIGEWALPGEKPDGKPGVAQRDGAGKSFNDYKRIILRQEGWDQQDDGKMVPRVGAPTWQVYDRRMDPRPAGTSVPSDEMARTYLDFMNDPVVSREGVVLVPGQDVMAAPACGIEEGTQLINDWLSEGWDASRPVDPLNCPRFYVSSACQNLIYALRTWTGQDGEKGASKDPIDCLKGAAKLGIEWVNPMRVWSRRNGE